MLDLCCFLKDALVKGLRDRKEDLLNIYVRKRAGLIENGIDFFG